MVYGDFKDLPRRAFSDKVLRDKAFNIARDPKHNGCQRSLASVVYKILIKRLLVGVLEMKIFLSKQNNYTKQLLEILIKEKFIHFFIDNIWDANLADMKLTRKFDKGFSFVLCAINIYRKYDWVIPWNDEKGITITNAFQKILKESNRNPKK